MRPVLACARRRGEGQATAMRRPWRVAVLGLDMVLGLRAGARPPRIPEGDARCRGLAQPGAAGGVCVRLWRRRLRQLRGGDRARRRGHRAHRGAGGRDSRPGDPGGARRQAHHPRQADGDDRGPGGPDGRGGHAVRRHVRGVSGIDAAPRRRHSRRASMPGSSATSPCCIRPAAGPSPRTGTSRARRVVRRPCAGARAARSSTKASTGLTCSAGWPAARLSRSRRKTANLVHKDIAVEDWGMATFTFANGIHATLEAAWTINAPRDRGPSPKQNSVVRLEVVGTRGEYDRSVVPRSRARGAVGRRRELGVRAAGGAAVFAGRRRSRSTT